MANKEQLKKVGLLCSEHRFRDEGGLSSDITVNNKEVKSCENCIHYTEDKRCDINLTDEILSNMAELDYE
ncbi:hypothetical protein [Dethiothermospora halolimnae]|uniref:hypothetical protein n=1 Tax=Dethiothermospora halolimnae TaxID=3114390 RepID=UPI003CCBC4D0